MTYLYAEYGSSALTKKKLYEDLKNYEKSVIYNLRSTELPNLLELVLDSVEAALAVIRLNPSTRAVVEVNE